MNFLLAAVCAASVSCSEVAPAPPTSVGEPKAKPVKMPPTNRKLGSSRGIALDEFFALQQAGAALVYDVRVAYFYAKDHIPGAVNWPYTEYDAQVQKRDLEIQRALNDGKKVVLYCFNSGCPEARNVAKKLARRDYDILVFGAGIDTWREAGLPVETGKTAE
ncbi:rhodanese-like domain-containing protein [Akkermansiaceae bacterium]|nr:rhodanese-like domain-containing protein [Akkermansiaceae bacterium]